MRYTFFMIVGNWKMYKTATEAREFIRQLIPFIKNSSRRVFLAVPFTDLPSSVEAAKGSAIVVGAQNMHDAEEGAFTGEISAAMLKDAGAQFVILGHSERRQLFHETDDWINRKVKRALKEKLTPILCIGESEQQREKGATKEVLAFQLEAALLGIPQKDRESLVIAYEPIWAIGTGKAATPEDAEEAHAFCRTLLPQKIPILYGGSVKTENIRSLLNEPNINGVLVGGASLNVTTFAKMIDALGVE
jgi:triosephosphate isomerase (TIM)